MAHPCYVCNFYPVPDGEGVECPHCHRFQYGTTCPKCGQNAPTLIRGLSVYCSACGAPRGPLTSGLPLNVVGRPSKLGGAVSRVAAWGTVVGTVLTAALLALLAGLFWSAGVALATALVVAVLGGLVAAVMFRGGRKLEQLGDVAQRHAREQAVYALASNRGGTLTATEVAAALNVHLAEADALLTGMAKEGARVSVEIDGSGVVHYVFRELQPVRVDASGGVRVDAHPQDEREKIKAEVDREYEQIRARQHAGKDTP